MKLQRNAKFALTTRLGQWTFRLAWVSAGTVGWLVALALTSLGLVSESNRVILDSSTIVALGVSIALVSVPILEGLLLRRYWDSWEVPNVSQSTGTTAMSKTVIEPNHKGCHLKTYLRQRFEGGMGGWFVLNVLAGIFVAIPVLLVVVEDR